MKTTKIMLACIATFILTWMFISFIGYIIADHSSYTQMFSNYGVVTIMFIIGWIPSIIVGSDLEEAL